MATGGILFDLDGTLLDSNPLHVRAWQKAFENHGHNIPTARIALEVGKGGDQLVPSILGPQEKEREEELKDAYAKAFEKLVSRESVGVLPGAIELIAQLRKRGLPLALASSSKGEMLEMFERASGWKFRAQFDALVTSDDAEASKPAPDVVSAALEKLGLSPAQCVLVGDTPFDALAARSGGVVCLGVLTSRLGIEEKALREAGARRVWDDCAAILHNLDEALRISSPQSVSLTQQVLEALMDEALQQARAGMEAGEVPIGAILANGEGKVIARAFNQMNATQMKTAHAEMMCFQDAAGKTPLDARDLILVSTLEPCVMCTGAAMEAAVETVVWGLEAPYDSGTQRVKAPLSPESQMPRLVPGVRRHESRDLLEQWLENNKSSGQSAFVEQLLAGTESK
jgi:HAD superfamily hydrolase (TIGR01509 family)